MANVGLLFVGAVLFINGLLLLGKADPKAAGVFNLFVGALQVLTPTILIVAADGDPRKILAASGIYLFGFTYLFVGIGLLTGFETNCVGYYSLFVAITALGYSFVNFRLFKDYPFGVIWLYWAFLWFMFYLLFTLKQESLTPFVGWVTAVEGWVTGVIPAFLLLSGYWKHPVETAIALGAFAVVVFGGLWVYTHRRRPAAPRTVSDPRGAPVPGPG